MRLELAALLETLDRRRVVLIGEQHDRYDHHLNQAEIICRLHARGANVAVGLEAFQQPFQDALDAFVRGERDLAGLLEESEYYDRWRFDHRLYEPILELARARSIRLVALNVPAEMTARVSRAGLGGLDPEDRARLPYGIEGPDPAYRDRLRAVFAEHRPAGPASPRAEGEGGPAPAARLARFAEVQWLWDEGMAQRAARFLAENPGTVLVIVAGRGHIAPADAIPARLGRAGPVSAARLLHASTERAGPGLGSVDAWLESTELRLPENGRLGVFLEAGSGAVRVRSLADPSAAGEAGVRAGDLLVSIDGHAVSSYADIKLALSGRGPGARVQVGLRRGDERIREIDIRLR